MASTRAARKAKARDEDNQEDAADLEPKKQAKLDSDEEQTNGDSTGTFSITMEFWRRAETLAADIRQKFENVKISLNPEKPRRGSFEVTLTPNSGKDSEVIWTGLKKGPPRKLKFPESEVIIKEIQKNLK